jgi:hypothetical protein
MSINKPISTKYEILRISKDGGLPLRRSFLRDNLHVESTDRHILAVLNEDGSVTLSRFDPASVDFANRTAVRLPARIEEPDEIEKPF